MALMALGWISVCGASYDPDLQLSVFDLSTRSGMQIIWIGTSLVLALLITGINERVWTTFGVAIYLLFMVLLFVTPFLARDIKGSLSWIKIGSFSIQPAEFAKFATALCAASYISRRGFSMRNKRDFILSCAIIVLPWHSSCCRRRRAAPWSTSPSSSCSTAKASRAASCSPPSRP